MQAKVSDGALIVADWGTSRLRAQLLAADGRTLAEAESDDGINRLAGNHEAAFERLAGGWPKVPAIMAGMVGSRQGWREAPYVAVPVAPEALASQVMRLTTSTGRTIAIVPGVAIRSASRDGDVMRGEETQIVGLLEAEPEFAGIAILPGTHSKWVKIEEAAIGYFQTYITGEIFELLSRQSFLRHSVEDGGGDLSAAEDFTLGVRRTAIEGLPFLGAIFSVRVRQLILDVAPASNLAYLSGLIIGGEIAAARAAGLLANGAKLRVVGTKSLGRAYRRALDLAGHDVETRDGAALARAGLVRLARASGLWAPTEKQA